jgi:hypothetical protein
VLQPDARLDIIKSEGYPFNLMHMAGSPRISRPIGTLEKNGISIVLWDEKNGADELRGTENA